MLKSNKHNDNSLYKRSKIYEKIIYQNPDFIPRDSFNEIFNILKGEHYRSIIWPGSKGSFDPYFKNSQTLIKFSPSF